MKKLILTTIALFMASVEKVSAQLVNTEGLDSVTQTVGKNANLSVVSIGALVAVVVKTILGLLAIVFLILTIIAGIKWMSAEGNEEAIGKAQKSLKSSIIGLLIVLAAYAITYFIFVNLPFSGGSMPQAT